MYKIDDFVQNTGAHHRGTNKFSLSNVLEMLTFF